MEDLAAPGLTLAAFGLVVLIAAGGVGTYLLAAGLGMVVWAAFAAQD